MEYLRVLVFFGISKVYISKRTEQLCDKMAERSRPISDAEIREKEHELISRALTHTPIKQGYQQSHMAESVAEAVNNIRIFETLLERNDYKGANTALRDSYTDITIRREYALRLFNITYEKKDYPNAASALQFIELKPEEAKHLKHAADEVYKSIASDFIKAISDNPRKALKQFGLLRESNLSGLEKMLRKG
jgi:hypothetical protein